MAQAFRETTTWADSPSTINHTYLLEGDVMIAYMRSQTAVPFYFKKPIRISRSGRKFQLVEPNPFDHLAVPVVAQTNEILEVEGSKGARYYVNLDTKTCTCPGYTYRGTCKHVKELDTA